MNMDVGALTDDPAQQRPPPLNMPVSFLGFGLAGRIIFHKGRDIRESRKELRGVDMSIKKFVIISVLILMLLVPMTSVQAQEDESERLHPIEHAKKVLTEYPNLKKMLSKIPRDLAKEETASVWMTRFGISKYLHNAPGIWMKN